MSNWTGNVWSERLRALAQEMDTNNIDVCWITNPSLRRYLVDEESEGKGIGCLLVYRDGRALQVIGEGRGASHADGLSLDVRTFTDYDMQFWAQPVRSLLTIVSEIIQSSRPKRVGLDYYLGFMDEDVLRFLSGCDLFDLRPYFNRRRQVKAPYEIERIRTAGVIHAKAYDAIRRNLQEGASEYDLFADMTAAAIRETRQFVNFCGKSDFISGERSVGAGGPPTSRILQRGDLVLVDLFPTICGYHADTCRTFVVGKPTLLQQRLVDTVRRALRRAEVLLRPGVKASEVFQGLNEVLRSVGYGYSLIHHAGHGIGVEDQERPYLVPGSQEILEEGMVISVEPGIYVEGLGIRMENAYVVTAGAPENLTPFPEEL